MAYFAVDRIEGRLVVLIGDDGSEHEIPRGALPKGLAEGSVLDVRVSESGTPDWTQAALDVPEQKRRIRQSQALLEELKRRDPGGDIVL